MISSPQAELQRFIARLKIAEEDSRAIKRDLIALRQGMRDAWTGDTRNPCLTTITGKVVGGDAAATGLAGATLQVAGHVTGTNYGTFALAAGTYALDLILDTADTSLDLVATGPGARFAANAATNKPVTQCGPNSVANIQATPAAGYAYLTGSLACQYPLKTTLSFVDSVIGSGTFTAGNSPCMVATSFASGVCVVASTPVNFVWLGNLAINLLWVGDTFGCPVVSACPRPLGVNRTQSYGTGLITSKVCPDQATLFDATWTIPGGSDVLFHGSGAQTIRVFET